MRKIVSNEVGSVVYWTDYINSKYYKDGDDQPVIEYKQSNTKLDGYCTRTVGLCRASSGYIVSVALSKEELTPKTEKSGKGVVVHRMKTLINNKLSTTVNDKGVTWVPYSYTSLLYNDKAAFSTLFGPIDPSSIKMAINLLDSQ